MNGRDVDAMWEASAAAEWERLNEEQPDPDEGRREDAKADLAVACKHLDTAREWMESAACEVIGLCYENDIDDFMATLDELHADMRILQEIMHEGGKSVGAYRR